MGWYRPPTPPIGADAEGRMGGVECLQMPRTSFKPEVTERIVELVQAGNYIETAAKAAASTRAPTTRG